MICCFLGNVLLQDADCLHFCNVLCMLVLASQFFRIEQTSEQRMKPKSKQNPKQSPEQRLEPKP